MSTSTSREPKDIVESMIFDIGNDVLGSDLADYASGSNNSATNWMCTGGKVLYAGWNGQGIIKFTAVIECEGELDLEKTMHGSNKVSQKVEGQLIDEGNYNFVIDSVECID